MPGPRNGTVARSDIDPAALALIARRGPEILATARHYSASLDDAEDAYQRGLEILLTKAPTTAEEELVPWLKTVVKHEAFAIRRQRQRAAPVSDDGDPPEPPLPAAAAHDQAERYERLRQGAEALRRLKPQEVRALLLRAEGYSYKQICEVTGWTYTKVNRCLSEGRAAFFEQIAGIEAGSECRRLAPQLSALADGEARAEDLAALRPHLKTCLACRARLREYRDAPSRVAALAPPAILLAGGGEHAPSALRGFVESLIGATQDKAAAFGERAHAAAELATGQKLAAVAASAAAIAGGGAAGVERLNGDDPARTPVPAARPEPAPDPQQTVVADEPAAAPAPAPAPAPPAPAPSSEPPPADPADEFGFEAAASAPPAAPATAAPAAGPAPAGGAPGGAAGGEFGP